MLLRIAKKFTEFDGTMPLQVNYLIEHRVRFLLSGILINGLRQGYSDWTAAYFQYQDPELRTNLLGRELDTLMKQQKALLRKVHNQIKASGLVELTDEDRIALVIPIDKSTGNTRSIPSEIIYSEVIEIVPRQVKILTKIMGAINQTGRSSRPTRTRIERRIAFTASEHIIPAQSDYQDLDSTGKMMYTLDFTREQQGKTAWLIVHFSNAHGSGADSDPCVFLIN